MGGEEVTIGTRQRLFSVLPSEFSFASLPTLAFLSRSRFRSGAAEVVNAERLDRRAARHGRGSVEPHRALDDQMDQADNENNVAVVEQGGWEQVLYCPAELVPLVAGRGTRYHHWLRRQLTRLALARGFPCSGTLEGAWQEQAKRRGQGVPTGQILARPPHYGECRTLSGTTPGWAIGRPLACLPACQPTCLPACAPFMTNEHHPTDGRSDRATDRPTDRQTCRASERPTTERPTDQPKDRAG